MGISIGGGVGPVRVSKRIGGGKGGGSGCLTLIVLVLAVGIGWLALTWPYRLGGWAAEIPYLIVVVGLPVAWFLTAVARDIIYYRKHGERRPTKRKPS